MNSSIYNRKKRDIILHSEPNTQSPLVSTLPQQPEIQISRRTFPLLFYLDEISPNDKFKYLVLILIIVLLVYRLNLSWVIWIGLVPGLLLSYYLNERKIQELHDSSDRLWAILKSPLLRKTKYFITDPPFIQWVDDVKEFKTINTLEFNKMITNLDTFLKLIYQIKIGVIHCRENIDLIQNLKIRILNQFHSIIYKLSDKQLIEKLNFYLDRLHHLLNQRHAKLIKISKLYYTLRPIDNESRLDHVEIDEPVPFNGSYDPHYHYYSH
ncbi:MAG: hypothetical protein ABIN35_00400 [candidate division WOR-3 bacterium]